MPSHETEDQRQDCRTKNLPHNLPLYVLLHLLYCIWYISAFLVVYN